MYSGLFNKHDTDTGYVIGWRYKKKLEAGKLEGEMTYGEAKKKAEELSAKEPEKSFWPEKKLEFTAH
jgi:hypothetical protein